MESRSELYEKIEELELQVHELQKQLDDSPEAIVVNQCVHGVNKFRRASDRSDNYLVWIDREYYSFGGDTFEEAKLRFEKIAKYKEAPDAKSD